MEIEFANIIDCVFLTPSYQDPHGQRNGLQYHVVTWRVHVAGRLTVQAIGIDVRPS